LTSATVVVGLLAVALVLGIARYTLSRRDTPPDDAPMPSAASRFLAFYLLALAIAAVYLVVKLFSVQFPDERSPQLAAPTFMDRPVAETKPMIVRVDSAMAEGAQPELRIYGYHFTPKTTVFVGDKPYPTARYIGEHLIVLPLDAADVAKWNTAFVAVETEGVRSDAALAQAVLPTGELSLLGRIFPISREVHLLLLVLVAGGLGSYVHSIRSLADYIGNRKLLASWFWFYFTKPFIGMAVALMFYAAIRGGFVAGSPADVKSVNPFGVFAIAAMVGMFVDKAGDKLADIFDALFKAADKREDKLTALSIDTKGPLEAKAGTAFTHALKATGGKKPYTWTQAGLPGTLTLDAATGVLAGTPGAQADIPVVVTVRDAAGAIDTETINLTVKP
jgi:putative Ig domain-containing protein